MNRGSIAVVGSSNVDFVMTMEHLPALGETVTDAEFVQSYGGKGANQAVAAARAGGETWFVNCVGDDDFSERMVETWTAAGLHTDYVSFETGIPSETALVMIGEGGSNYLSVAPGANYRLTPDYLDRASKLFEHASLILLQYEIPVPTIAAVIDIANARRIPVMWNFAPARRVDMSLFRRVQYLVVNEVEAEFLVGRAVTGVSDALTAAVELRTLGPERVLITLGPAGAVYATEAGAFAVDPFRVAARDTTGAGDIFCGALAVALNEGRPLEQAVRFASAASAISVTRVGAQPSAPSRAEIEEFLQAQG